MSVARRIIGNIVTWRNVTRCHATSALFVSNRSSKSRPVLTPTPALASKFADIERLQSNVDARGLNINTTELRDLWKFHNEMDIMRNRLEMRRTEIADEIKALKKAGDPKDETERLRLQGRIVRDDLKQLLQSFWEVEEKMMVQCLDLPNDLHQDTPLSEGKIIAEFGRRPKTNEPVETHLSLGKDLIDFRGPQTYYLKGSAALFDLALTYYFTDSLKSDGFIPVASPDFVTAAVIEGCGASLDTALLLEPSEKNMYLVGGTSLAMFCTNYAKQKISLDSLPARHLSSGRKYKVSDGPGLFGAWQRSCVDVFTISSSQSDAENEFNGTVKKLTSFYERLGWEVRIEYVAAPKLSSWESLRASFQMFAPSLSCWVEVGSLGLSGTFLSERLSMEFESEDKSKGFLHVVSGTAVDVITVLACLLESRVGNLFPDVLTPYSLAN